MDPALRIVVMGVCGCGKTTLARALARRLGLAFVEGDELHPPRNVAIMAAGTPLSDADRSDWLDAVAARLGSPAADGPGIVVTCSALKRSYRDRLRRAAPDLRLLHLHGPRELLAQRMAARTGHYMPASLLDSQLAILEPPAADEQAITLDSALSTPAQLDAACAALGRRPLPTE